MKSNGESAGKTRGKFLARCAQFFAALGLVRIPEYAVAQTAPVRFDPNGKPPNNIIFIIVDQRVEKLLAGSDYSLPAMEALADHGVTFQQPLHRLGDVLAVARVVSDRPAAAGHRRRRSDAVLVRAQPKPATCPNMGSVLKGLGYKTAYFGKFEMDKAILNPSLRSTTATPPKPTASTSSAPAATSAARPTAASTTILSSQAKAYAGCAKRCQRSAQARTAVLHGREFR